VGGSERGRATASDGEQRRVEAGRRLVLGKRLVLSRRLFLPHACGCVSRRKSALSLSLRSASRARKRRKSSRCSSYGESSRL